MIRGTGLLISVAASLALCQHPAMFRGNPARTGVYETKDAPQSGGIQWKFKTGGRVLSSPAVDGLTVYAGSDDKHLYAVDRGTGKEKWRFKTDGPVTSSPAVAGGLVYFGSFDGEFYAVDSQSGQLKWKFKTAGERRFEAKHLHGYKPPNQTVPDAWDFYLSSPAVEAGLVYFGSGDGNLYALDRWTGQLKWKFATGDVVHSSPAVADGVVYFGSWDSHLYAVDAVSGQLKWKFKTGEDNENHNQAGFQASPAVVGGIVYVGCRDAHLYAVDAKTGTEKWNFPTKGSWVIASPAVLDGVVYFGTSDSALFHALDAQTGAARFSLDAKTFVFASPAAAGESVYFGTFGGKLTAIDRKSGKTRWEFQTEASKENALGILTPEGKLKVPAVFTSDYYDDMIPAVNKLLSLGSILSSPAVEDGVVYFGSADGYLYAVK